MRDARLAQLAGRQHNRLALRQLHAVGLSDEAVRHRVASGRLVIVEEGVYAVAPVLDDPRGRWMAATLTAPGTVLSHASAGEAWGLRPRAPGDGGFETVTRPGSGGPRRFGGVLVHRSATLGHDTTVHLGISVTTPERTLLDLAPLLGQRALAKATREAIRLGLTSVASLRAALARHPGRRGSRRMTLVAERLVGLPLRHARSDAESRAMEVLSEAARPLPRLNHRIAGEEADLSWPEQRLIIEIDGPQFHLDAAEDARKQAVWELAGWTVRRVPSGVVFDAPTRLLALAPTANVRQPAPERGFGDVRRAATAPPRASG